VEVLTRNEVDPKTLKEIYIQIARIHAVDQAIQSGLQSGRFACVYWPFTGHEAIPACLQALLNNDDFMVTTYRGIHDQVAKGVPLKGLFSEMLGRATGLNKGKGGSPHISDPASGSMLTTGIVGAGAPIANGLALAQKLRGTGRVSIVNFGDGATSIGAVHEAMNLAGAWKLPVLFVVQNNQIGEYTLIPDYTATKQFIDRAPGYGFRGIRANGNDIVDMYLKAREAVEHVRSGEGPVMLEAVVNRLGPHAGFGNTDHLGREGLREAKKLWSVRSSRALLLERGVATDDELTAIETAAAEEAEAALKFAVESPPPPEAELSVDVFDDPKYIPDRENWGKPIAGAPVAPKGRVETMDMVGAVLSAQDLAMAKHKEVILLGEDVGDPPGGLWRTSNGLQIKYGKDRILPTPIAEQSIIGAGIGSALVGMRPICEIMFSDFTAVCMDQIANHAAKQRYMSGGATHVPMTIRVISGNGFGSNGAQHSQSLEAWLLHTPGLKVVYPSTPYDAKGLLTSCIWDNDPCVHMESMTLLFGSKSEVPLEMYSIPLGVADVKRRGGDVTIIAYGRETNEALAAAEVLATEGIDVEVVDLRSLVPLDYATVFESVRKTGRGIVVHGATEFCGLGSEIAATVNEVLWTDLKAPMQRHGALYGPLAYARDLELKQMPGAASIAARVRKLFRV